MKLERSYITLKGLRFRAFHGVLPQERLTGGDFLVTVKVGYPLATAMASDDVADTVNYAALYDRVAQEMAKPSKLLEHVAGRIAKAIEEAVALVSSVDLKVTELNPPMGADCEGAEVEIKIGN